jgi:hypothetical protein
MSAASEASSLAWYDKWSLWHRPDRSRLKGTPLSGVLSVLLPLVVIAYTVYYIVVTKAQKPNVNTEILSSDNQVREYLSPSPSSLPFLFSLHALLLRLPLAGFQLASFVRQQWRLRLSPQLRRLTELCSVVVRQQYTGQRRRELQYQSVRHRWYAYPHRPPCVSRRQTIFCCVLLCVADPIDGVYIFFNRTCSTTVCCMPPHARDFRLLLCVWLSCTLSLFACDAQLVQRIRRLCAARVLVKVCRSRASSSVSACVARLVLFSSVTLMCQLVGGWVGLQVRAPTI